MKRNFIKACMFLSLSAFAVVSCKKDITEGVVEVLNVADSKATVSFQFVDANTGQLLDMDGSEDIQIRLGGINADDVVDNFGAKKYGADFGILALAIQGSLYPSEESPVDFTVHATANGYFPSSTDVTIIEEGHTHISVSMVSVSSAPQDIRVATDVVSGVASNGETTSNFTLSPSVSSSGTTAQVVIPSGTKLMGSNGSAASGNVEVELAYIDPNGDNKNLALPGDLSRALMNNGEYVAFNTLGAISMEMNAGSTEVTNFDTPIQMTISIPSGAEKFDGTPVAAGDDYGVYSYDEENSNWKLESTEIVSLNTTSGLLEVTFDMAHLSTWQLAEGQATERQRSYNKVTFNSNCQDYFFLTDDIVFEYRIGRTQSSSNLVVKEVAQFSFDKPKTLRGEYMYHNTDQIYDYYKWYKKDDPNNVIWADASYASNPTVNLPDAWCEDVNKTFKLLLETSCPDNPNRIYKPDCFVLAYEEGNFQNVESWKILGQMKGGELETNTSVLTAGKNYTIACFYQDKFVFLTGTLEGFNEGSVLIDGNDIDLSRPLTNDECAYLKG